MGYLGTQSTPNARNRWLRRGQILHWDALVGYSGWFSRERSTRFLRRPGLVELLLSTQGDTDLIAPRQTSKQGIIVFLWEGYFLVLTREME